MDLPRDSVRAAAWIDAGPPGRVRSDLDRAHASRAPLPLRPLGDRVTERGERVTGDTLLLLLNADDNGVAFTLPAHAQGQYWEELVDTANGVATPQIWPGGDQYQLQPRAMAVFRLSVPKRRRRTDLEASEEHAPTPREGSPASVTGAAQDDEPALAR